MPGKKPIIVVGSINLDLVAVTERIPAVGETVLGLDFQIHPGGKGANQAVAVARLGYPVCMIGRLGNDAFGSQLRTHLQSVGVDLSGVATSPGASGVAVIEVSSKGENSIIVAPGANAKVTPQDVTDNLGIIRQAGMVLTQLEIPLETVEHLASVCARENVPLILDPAPARELPKAILEKTQWLTPNELEAAFYSSGHSLPSAQIAQSILANGCRGVILKLGSQGVYLTSRDGVDEFVPAFRVKAVDTTAAGDAFNGAFAVGLMLGKSPQQSAVFGAAVAAISVTRVGAQPAMPTMAEVASFLHENSTICL
ncbi:MAG TPA: ribokinase [Alloacidobacterium sp.]|nr:ribokinase [Alloacidobacterium sp.]